MSQFRNVSEANEGMGVRLGGTVDYFCIFLLLIIIIVLIRWHCWLYEIESTFVMIKREMFEKYLCCCSCVNEDFWEVCIWATRQRFFKLCKQVPAFLVIRNVGTLYWQLASLFSLWSWFQWGLMSSAVRLTYSYWGQVSTEWHWITAMLAGCRKMDNHVCIKVIMCHCQWLGHTSFYSWVMG